VEVVEVAGGASYAINIVSHNATQPESSDARQHGPHRSTPGTSPGPAGCQPFRWFQDNAR